MRYFPLTVLLFTATVHAQDKARFAGPTDTGFLLPNGWHLTPVGQHVVTTDLPLNIIPLRDSRHALVATSGYNRHELSLVDFAGEPKVVTSEMVRQSWYGLALDKQEAKVWWSGGGYGKLHTFDLTDGKLTLTSPLDPAPRKEPTPKAGAKAAPVSKEFRSGLFLDEARGVLYALGINTGELTATSLTDGTAKTAAIGGRPYDILLGPRGHQLYVSDWAGRQVLVIDPAELRVVRKVPVGEHPNQMALHKDGRLFVACASSNCVSVIDTKRGHVTETIVTSLFPKAPEGSTPDAVALSPDGNTLYVANADNNCVAVIDVEEPRKSAVKGFVPTGWYPTALAVTPDGKNLLVGVGKGLQSKSNPFKRKDDKPLDDKELSEGVRKLPFPYIGTTMHGALSVVPVPDEKTLKEYTARVYRNCPYSDDQLTAAPHSEKTAVPTKVGDPSPIKYVIYIIKENRTYDQVFGDLAAGDNPKGNGDATLCMFPRKVTPNHHRLAEEFVLLDNLYCNGQVSRDGHPWSTMAYNTDYISRDWHLTYSRRKGVDDDDEGHLQNAPSGYLWDACARAGLSYRSYGEYGKRVSDGTGAARMEGRVPGLVGHMCPDYGVPKKPGERVRDTENVVTFLKEYDEFVNKGTMPRFIVMSLGEDHTTGTTPGTFTPQACVASNDLALGRLVEHVSNSPLWRETAIFVIEDDAQNGPDHVDAHRTVGLVISPFTKRKHIDRTQYSTVSLIRTMELILGLEPLSQYDAAARPMFHSFTAKPDLTAYKHEPARIDLNTKNTPLAYGADRSSKMDFSEYDRIDDFELNEVLWHAVMGPGASQPPAVRRAIAFRSMTGSRAQK
ncbi:MAG TPA: beta-propeller fold lactonase family protein [Gemmataceae bacterium]|nr:beta-propeller fold lactonase family protein [Gemmataceae bacterium]